jgi:hypothetical protein
LSKNKLFFVVLGVGFRALSLLGRCCTNRAILPALHPLSPFFCFCGTGGWTQGCKLVR